MKIRSILPNYPEYLAILFNKNKNKTTDSKLFLRYYIT